MQSDIVNFQPIIVVCRILRFVFNTSGACSWQLLYSYKHPAVTFQRGKPVACCWRYTNARPVASSEYIVIWHVLQYHKYDQVDVTFHARNVIHRHHLITEQDRIETQWKCGHLLLDIKLMLLGRYINIITASALSISINRQRQRRQQQQYSTYNNNNNHKHNNNNEIDDSRPATTSTSSKPTTKK